MNILAICGSLSATSINKALLRAAQIHAPEGMQIELLGVGGLPLFNQDDEKERYPAAATEAKAKIAAADGVLIATPEYNRAPPGPLKNFIDWVSRPDGDHPWSGKAVGVLGASTGPRGASFAQYDIRRTMGYFNARVMGQPEFYLGDGRKKIEQGVLVDAKAIEVLQKYLATFARFVG